MKSLAPLAVVVLTAWLVPGCETTASAERSRFSGTLRCRSPLDLPEKNTITIALRDGHSPSPSEAISVQVVQNARAWPVDFSVAYDPRLIRASESYFLTVTVAFDGRIQADQKRFPVLTQGAPAEHAEVWVETTR